jgi:1-acyl-sn-glycerol-3-phosphate acyltransferase
MINVINVIRSIIIFIILLVGTIITASLICIIMPIQWLLPKKYYLTLLKSVNRLLHFWYVLNSWTLSCFTPTRWIINIPKTINKKHWYLLTANHRSWADILMLFKAFHDKSDRLMFFLKRELLWLLPIAGFACYLLGYPFLVRHSKKDLRKNPKLKGKDIETTIKACEKFKTAPCIMINFLEGTRFKKDRHTRQKSPYQHLLKPKAGGVALVLNSMKDHLSGILDVTIKYSTPQPTFWKLISGQIKTIEITANLLPVDESLIGDYYGDRNFRKVLQHYLNQMWSEKDTLLSLQHQKENDKEKT